MVEPGQACTLSWSSEGDDAFILNHGHVKPNGSLELKPAVSATYALVIEKDGQFEMLTTSVDVKGQRGGPPLPSGDDFKASSNGSETALKYLDFLAVVESVLETNHFEFLGTFLQSQPYVVYFTDHPERNNLQSKAEHGRNVHRISYCVQVNKPTEEEPKKVSFTVRTLIEFRPVAESDWYASTDTELLHSCADSLRDQILSAANAVKK